MTTVELEILDHLNTNWNLSPTISWAYSNVVFSYKADQEYLIPTMTTLNSEILEVPAESGAIRVDYSLGLNLLLIENTGMSSAKTYTDKLRTIFHKKNIQTSSHLYNFWCWKWSRVLVQEHILNYLCPYNFLFSLIR